MKVLTLFIGLLALTHGCDEEKVKMLKERVKTLEDIVGKWCELTNAVHYLSCHTVYPLYDLDFFLARQSEQVIRFDAYRTQLDDETDDEAYIPAGVQVTFDDVHVNTGGGFDTRDNQFVAPIDGVYIFFFSSECIDLTIHCHTEIRRNNQVFSAFHDDTSSREIAHQVNHFPIQYSTGIIL